MPVDRHLPTEEATELLALTRELAREELAPRVSEYEAEGRFPREVFATLGKAGLLGLPYDERYGGGDDLTGGRIDRLRSHPRPRVRARGELRLVQDREVAAELLGRRAQSVHPGAVGAVALGGRAADVDDHDVAPLEHPVTDLVVR